MIAEFAKKINDILIYKGIVQKEDADLYQYGIENGITIAGNLIASVIFGIVTGRPGLVLVFLLFYASLRSYSGGSHCKSRIGCFLISMAILFIPVYTYEPVMENVPNAVILLIGVLAVVIIIALAPVESINKPLDEEERKYYASDIIDGGSTDYYVNGKKVFTAYNAIDYTYDEVKSFGTISPPFRTYKHQEYNPVDNSINIAVGDRYNLGNGYRLTIKKDCVWGEGYGSGSSADDERMNTLVYGMNALVHFADQQYFSSMIDENSTPMVLQFLKELGVDTSKEFIINGTKCEVKYGRINEVGNTHVVPNSIYEKALKRYEELLYQPLSTYYEKNSK